MYRGLRVSDPVASLGWHCIELFQRFLCVLPSGDLMIGGDEGPAHGSGAFGFLWLLLLLLLLLEAVLSSVSVY